MQFLSYHIETDSKEEARRLPVESDMGDRNEA